MALPANALTVTATIETELGIAAGTQTALLERLIGVASDSIEKYCGRNFNRLALVNERYAGQGTEKLLVARTPIDVSVPPAVTLDGSTVDPASFYVQDAEQGILYRSAGWSWTAPIQSNVASPSQVPGLEEKVYLVSYTGGYYLPSAGGLRNLPYDLEQACIIAVVSTYRGRGKYQRLVEETDGGDPKPWYDYVLPPNCRALLAGYRRVA